MQRAMEETDRRRTEEAGFHHHLVKPVDLEQVTRILARAPEVTETAP